MEQIQQIASRIERAYRARAIAAAAAGVCLAITGAVVASQGVEISISIGAF